MLGLLCLFFIWFMIQSNVLYALLLLVVQMLETKYAFLIVADDNTNTTLIESSNYPTLIANSFHNHKKPSCSILKDTIQLFPY